MSRLGQSFAYFWYAGPRQGQPPVLQVIQKLEPLSRPAAKAQGTLAAQPLKAAYCLQLLADTTYLIRVISQPVRLTPWASLSVDIDSLSVDIEVEEPQCLEPIVPIPVVPLVGTVEGVVDPLRGSSVRRWSMYYITVGWFVPDPPILPPCA